MTAKVITTQPIEGQKPGTSGLRKKTRVFMQPNFLENYVQSIFNGIGGVEKKTLVVGGDGRYFNNEAIDIILRMAAANGASQCIVGRDGILSTPAASHIIRKRKADGGLILSASHNPGGPEEDFGLKYNGPNGGPATETVTEKIFTQTLEINSYKIIENSSADLNTIGSSKIAGMNVLIIDPIEEYADLMAQLIDFKAISAMFQNGFRMCFDAMHAVTGPYAHEILEKRLGAPKGTVINGKPSPDFGGGHPDPNPVWAKELMDIMYAENAPDFGAASDGDGDRNMIVGRNCYVSPSDSLAVLADLAHFAPGYAKGLAGIARSMPTSAAADSVAKAKGIEIFETPTGWKFFGNLLDAGKATICGEESAGTGSNHVREKDGLWAVLMWLNILAVSKKSVSELMINHWETYGRNYYCRHDYEAVDSDVANELMNVLRDKLSSLKGRTEAGMTVTNADEFSYDDPVDGSYSKNQGIRIFFEGGGRAVFRLSGTGTQGATIRVYLEQLETNPSSLQNNPHEALSKIAQAANILSELSLRTGRNKPDVIT
jgi:phosphoglucomutase